MIEVRELTQNDKAKMRNLEAASGIKSFTDSDTHGLFVNGVVTATDVGEGFLVELKKIIEANQNV